MSPGHGPGHPLLKKALRLLKIRPRSRGELARTLAAKAPREDVEILLKELESKGLVDDASFARQWVEERSFSGKYGPRRIRKELLDKGLDEDLVRPLLEEFCSSQWQRQKLSEQEPGDPSQRPVALRRWLARGFDPDLVEEWSGRWEADRERA